MLFGGASSRRCVEQRLDDQLEDQPEPPLPQVGLGGGGALVEQADGVEQGVVLGGDSPGRMALRFAFGLDVAAELDQGDQAIEPGPVLDGRASRGAG